jgi:hypothetical protein
MKRLQMHHAWYFILAILIALVIWLARAHIAGGQPGSATAKPLPAEQREAVGRLLENRGVRASATIGCGPHGAEERPGSSVAGVVDPS